MFTTCPKCSLKLVVTAADLRVAQGYVRCGRCSNVFNALAGLSDEQQAVLAREPAAEPQELPGRDARAETAPPQTEEPIPDDALEFDASSTDVSEVFVEPPDDDPTGTFESIVLRSDDLDEGTWSEPEGEAQVSSDPGSRTGFEPQQSDALPEDSATHEFEVDLEALVATGDTHPQPEVAKQQAPAALEATSNIPVPASTIARKPAAEIPVPPSTTARKPAAEIPVPPSTTARKSAAGESARHVDVAPTPALEPRREPLAVELASLPQERPILDDDESDDQAHFNIERALRVGSVALAVLLVLQIVNHERAELAGFSWLQAPLTAIYSGLGMPLTPHWNVRAYEVRQLGAVASDPGALTVRASVKNTAPREQPLPLLRVTMQDRFGNRIAARDVPPSAYLPAGSSNRTELAAGQRVDAEIAFADPGPNAVGFEIDACLKLTSGRVACANDAGPER